MYKTRVTQAGHWLSLDLTQPCRAASVTLDYSATDIGLMTVLQLSGGATKSIIRKLPDQIGSETVAIDSPGWLMPKSGFAFVWTLAAEDTELTDGERTPRPRGQAVAATASRSTAQG